MRHSFVRGYPHRFARDGKTYRRDIDLDGVCAFFTGCHLTPTEHHMRLHAFIVCTIMYVRVFAIGAIDGRV